MTPDLARLLAERLPACYLREPCAVVWDPALDCPGLVRWDRDLGEWRIILRPDLSATDTLLTTLHEIAHLRLGHLRPGGPAGAPTRWLRWLRQARDGDPRGAVRAAFREGGLVDAATVVTALALDEGREEEAEAWARTELRRINTILEGICDEQSDGDH